MNLSLSQDLHRRCRAILLRCEEFDSHSSLQAIFVTTELRIFQSRLPQAHTKEERVTKTIAYLVEQRLSDDRPIAPLFLSKLRDNRYEGDVLRDELDQLCTEVKRELSKLEYHDIPFVIVTMTYKEANDLITETIFDHPDVAPAEKTKFQQLKAALSANEIKNWLSRYAEEREDWKPHTHPQNTIRSLILQAADRQRDPQIGPNGSLIRPQFFSVKFLAADDQKRIDTWDQLSASGCVIVVDAISLFHPVIYRRLLQSEMSSKQHVAIAILILSSNVYEANILIEKELEKRLQRAFWRFARLHDHFCEFRVRDLLEFERWIDSTLPEIAKKIQLSPRPDNLKMMRQRVSEIQGIDKLISGNGGN